MITVKSKIFIAILILAAIFISGYASQPKKMGAFIKDGYLIGGSMDGNFVPASEIKNHLRGKKEYNLYSISSLAGYCWGKKPQVVGNPESNLYRIDFSKDFSRDMIAVYAKTWNPMPQKPVFDNYHFDDYKAIVREILKINGMPEAYANITQVAKIDLDQDGTQEEIISASNFGINSMAWLKKKKYYSFVLLRKKYPGETKNIVISGSFYLGDGLDVPAECKLEHILDLNGDKVMDIVLSESYDYGFIYKVYEIRNGQAVPALQLNIET